MLEGLSRMEFIAPGYRLFWAWDADEDSFSKLLDVLLDQLMSGLLPSDCYGAFVISAHKQHTKALAAKSHDHHGEATC